MMKTICFCLIIATHAWAQPNVTPPPILRQYSEISPDGSYSFAYETANGIGAEEQGYIRDAGVEGKESQIIAGQYQYTAPDGQVIKVVYTADDEGFHPQGEHFPTPPPIPKEILGIINNAEQ